MEKEPGNYIYFVATCFDTLALLFVNQCFPWAFWCRRRDKQSLEKKIRHFSLLPAICTFVFWGEERLMVSKNQGELWMFLNALFLSTLLACHSGFRQSILLSAWQEPSRASLNLGRLFSAQQKGEWSPEIGLSFCSWGQLMCYMPCKHGVLFMMREAARSIGGKRLSLLWLLCGSISPIDSCKVCIQFSIMVVYANRREIKSL